MASDRSLPVWQIHDQIISTLRTHPRIVVIAPTGSGKTTQIPQMLLDSGFGELSGGPGKIIVLQPRRVAARTVATRVAWERNVKLGDEVGYQVRFEEATSLGTRICFVTEGILLRWLQSNPRLDGIAAVLFDEFHERNLLSDVALAVCKRLQQTRRPDLKLLVMSATLDAEPVAVYLQSDQGAPCPILRSEGRMFPVDIVYAKSKDTRPLWTQAADRVEDIVRSGEEGHVLVFMPGMSEIQATLGEVSHRRLGERINAIPLHGELPPQEQDRAFAPSDARKVVVATNVAETSVTIDGIRFVVDAGLARIARYDGERGVNTLFVEEISRASAEQRAGRAGRTAPGVCYRLWTESNQLNREAKNTPEIQRSDLAEVVLLLHSLGVKRAAEFDWMDRPDEQAVIRAERLLEQLGAVTAAEDGASDLTSIGREMLRMPVHPRYSRMLIEAAKRKCYLAAALCAALVSGRDLLTRVDRFDTRSKGAREGFEVSEESDFFTMMAAFQFAKERSFALEPLRAQGIHAQTARLVAQTFQQFLALRRKDVEERWSLGEARDRENLLRSILSGFIDQVGVRRDSGTLECQMVEGRSVTLMRESVVSRHPEGRLFCAANVREMTVKGRGATTLVGLASIVRREWLEEDFAFGLREEIEHEYDRTHKRVAAARVVRLFDLVIEKVVGGQIDPAESGRALAKAWREKAFELPQFNHSVRQLMARAQLIHKLHPDLGMPSFAMDETEEVMAKALHGIALVKEAQAKPVSPAFRGALKAEQLELMDELAPESVVWPEGKTLKLTYLEQELDDSPVKAPEVQVKLGDVLRTTDHPMVGEGTVAVRVWLQAPDGKRLDSTCDWPSFKAKEYPKLKPNLTRKYPGSPWI